MLNFDTVNQLTRAVQDMDTFKSLRGDERRGAAGFLDCYRGLSDSPKVATHEELISIALDYQFITSGYPTDSTYAKGAYAARDLLRQAIAAR